MEEVFELAFRLAAGRWGLLTSIHGETPLAAVKEGWFGPCPRWKGAGDKVAARYPTVKLEHQHVDFASMRLLNRPSAFDVIVADATFGQMLLDQAALFGTSLGLRPKGSMGEGSKGVYEPVHGPCTEMSGKGMANPMGAILAAAMMLRHSLGLLDEANALEAGVATVIAQGGRTVDGGGISRLSTREVGEAVCRNIEQNVGADLARLLGHWG
jgi:3-isopropylmalate dehydrogenase